VVKEAFQKNIQITKVAWDIEKDSLKQNGNEVSERSITLLVILAIEIEIKESELPAKALTYISTTYPYKKIKETKITDDKR
jgi:hypothetical protein